MRAGGCAEREGPLSRLPSGLGRSAGRVDPRTRVEAVRSTPPLRFPITCDPRPPTSAPVRSWRRLPSSISVGSKRLAIEGRLPSRPCPPHCVVGRPVARQEEPRTRDRFAKEALDRKAPSRDEPGDSPEVPTVRNRLRYSSGSPTDSAVGASLGEYGPLFCRSSSSRSMR